LFAVVFFWTPPHFWALAIRYRDDYERAGIPMLPVVATPIRVVRDMTIYAWLTVAASLAVWPLGAGWIYGVLAAVAGVVLLTAVHQLYARVKAGSDPNAMTLFHLSNSYLAFIFVAIAIDTFVRH
jgi:heme o synthase